MRNIFLILFSLFTIIGFSQQEQQAKLEAEKERLMKKMEEMSATYQQQKKKEKNVLKEIALQDEQIKLSSKAISTIAKQTRILSDDIYLTQLDINKYKRELEIMKADYAKMIVKSYKSKNEQSQLMFVLSSNSFLQAYKRIQYMKQYAGYRKMQAEEIKEKQRKLEDAKVHLEGSKKEKEVVLQEKTKVKQMQETAKQEKVKLANSIKKDKKKLLVEIEKAKKESRAIDAKIRKMIAAAIAEENRRIAAEKAKVAATKSGNTSIPTKPVVVSSSKVELTPETKLISDNFKANKGRLPWPVEKGYISQGYGDLPHPQFPNLTIHNSGVDISTDSGSSARAVFGGEVSDIQISPNTNTYTVLIRHGEYFSTYSNLASVGVKKGQKVSMKQGLGRIKTNASGATIMKFTISQNGNYSNPKSWVTSR